MAPTFDAILFDIGDTLWHAAAAPPPAEFRRRAAERAGAALIAMGHECPDPDRLARVAWASITDAMAAARASDLVEPDYAEGARLALRREGAELSRFEARRFIEAIYISGSEGGKEPFQGARETLLELRTRGFRLGVVTNRAFGGARFREDLRDAGLDIGWDVESVSVEVGFLKPHPRLFEHALHGLRVPPDRALMVGNSLAEDILGAQGLGMAAAWKRSKPDAEGVVPDLTFDELPELLNWPPLAEAARGH